MEIGFHPSIVARLTGRAVQSTGSGVFPLPGDEYAREIDIWIEMAQSIGLDALALKNRGIGYPSEHTHPWAMDGGTIKTMADVERIIDRHLSFVNPTFEACAPILISKCREAGLGCFLETNFGIGVTVTSIGFGDFFTYSIERPEIISRFFDYCAQGFTPVLELFHSLRPDFILIGDDIAFGQGPYLRPGAMKELVLSHLEDGQKDQYALGVPQRWESDAGYG